MQATTLSRIIPYITLGYPDFATTQALLELFATLGIKRVEIGIPFSDPMADGPVIQAASDYALSRGVRFLDLAQLKLHPDTEYYVMTYVNLFARVGAANRFAMLRELGIRGAIIPDLAPEHAAPFRDAAREHGIDLVSFISTSSDESRVRAIAESATGFLYAVSSAAVTGTKISSLEAIAGKIAIAREVTATPICIGFGIRDAATVRDALHCADGAIVGSALIEKISPALDLDTNIANVKTFLESLAE